MSADDQRRGRSLIRTIYTGTVALRTVVTDAAAGHGGDVFHASRMKRMLAYRLDVTGNSHYGVHSALLAPIRKKNSPPNPPGVVARSCRAVSTVCGRAPGQARCAEFCELSEISVRTDAIVNKFLSSAAIAITIGGRAAGLRPWA